MMRTLQCLADALRQVDIGGRNGYPGVVLVDFHDPVQRMLDALVLGFVVNDCEQFRSPRRD